MSCAARLRFRVDFAHQCSVGIGKIQLLEKIASHGSLTQAARELRMGYRRAWLLLKDLNRGFDRAVTEASVGGRGGGAASVCRPQARLKSLRAVSSAARRPRNS